MSRFVLVSSEEWADTMCDTGRHCSMTKEHVREFVERIQGNAIGWALDQAAQLPGLTHPEVLELLRRER